MLLTHDGRGLEAKRAALYQLELDAMKEGARKAAEIATNTEPKHPTCHATLCRDAILTQSSQWTEKDL